jgi:predicted MFS family arabinose efflux permease
MANRTGRGWVTLMTIGCGLAVANLYYNQPLLAQMGHTFGATSRETGWVAMLTQLGYAFGMLLFVPLGDRLERRGLITAMLIAVSVALAAAAIAPGLGWLVAASLAIGVTTIAPQLLIPFAAQLAAPEERGKIVGTLMGGLLIGILLARTAAGFIGELAGWRATFWMAAGAMLMLAGLMRWRLPESRPTATISYVALLGSMAGLVREHRVLAEAAAIGALLFGAFSAFWTTLVFHLAAPPFLAGSREAGLFGLIGVVGAAAAPIAGRLADRRSARATVGVAAAITLASFGVLYAGQASYWGLALGVVLLDLGVQAAQVSNQARIYALPQPIHSRANTIYMVSYFAGGAAGSAIGAYAWSAWRWAGVCAAGLAMCALALLIFAVTARLHRPPTKPNA